MMFCKTKRVRRAPTGSLSPDAKAMPIAAGGEYRFDMMSGQAIARPSGMLCSAIATASFSPKLADPIVLI